AALTRAAPPPPPTTTPTAATTTTDVTATTETTTTATATTSTTTSTTTTTVAATTAPPPKPKPRSAGKLLVATPVATPRCLVLAGFALLRPGRPPLAPRPVPGVRGRAGASEDGGAYPGDGSVLTASSVGLSGSGCRTSAEARAVVGSLSLFGGAATIRSVEVGVRDGIAGKNAAVTGLTVGGKEVAATPG